MTMTITMTMPAIRLMILRDYREWRSWLIRPNRIDPIVKAVEVSNTEDHSSGFVNGIQGFTFFILFSMH